VTARLVRFVHVDGMVFGPGDDVPPGIAAKITNPKAWVGGEVPTGHAPAGTSPGGEVPEPPRSGPGSSKAAWVEYAAARGVNVADDASREDVIAAVDAASTGD